MSTFQVRVLYDFSGEPNTAELSITAGDILTVTRDDVGEGWWEGLNSNGTSGLFPESYVEKISSGPPVTAPPVLPPSQPQTYNNDWDTFMPDSQDKDSDDDWDEDMYSEIPTKPEQVYSNRLDTQQSTEESNYNSVDNKGTVTKKSLNRFSTFVKSGGESYILGELKLIVPDDKRVVISKYDDVYCWPPITNHYSVHITSPKKETKLKGLKSFIAYQLSPSFDNNSKVSRRYKHFDWLHERLVDKYSLLAIPPLPDKQISGRYEDQFIEHRRLQLQEFVDYVCKHPILSRSEVWLHFLTCTDEKLWKQGKRQAERDQLTGVNYCLSVEAPDKELMPSVVENTIDSSINFIHNLDAAIKNLMITASEQTKKHQGPYKREYTKIGESFHKFGMSLSSEDKASTSRLPTAIVNMGTAYYDIAKLYDDQPKMDWEPLSNRLYLYRGITGCFPEIFATQKGAQQKRKECEKNNMPPAELHGVRRRNDILTCTIFAEMNHFKTQRNEDMKAALQLFLQEQICFYKKIVNKLESTLTDLNDV